MDFRIADSFTDSLGRLTSDEQRAVKTTAFDLQLNPANPGMNFHKLERAKDPNFWSVRVNADIRLIVHRSAGSLLLCYVSHHDKAYQWAERRKLEVHPRTGAAQFVEIRERVEEIMVRKYIETTQPSPGKPLLFKSTPERVLLGFGVPEEWIADVRLADEDRLLDLIDHLPAEAAEALFVLASGGRHVAGAAWEETDDVPALLLACSLDDTPLPDTVDNIPASAVLDDMTFAAPVEVADSDGAVAREAFEHPDAQRRFRTIHNLEELERAFAFPWEKWTIFLHPDQRQLVERYYGGPARVSGSAGTGKTVVALHRAAYLARNNPDGRVLLTTFSVSLANALRAKLRHLIRSEPRLGERIDVMALDAVGIRLHETQFGPVRLISRDELGHRLAEAGSQVSGLRFGVPFLVNEWAQVVDAWQISSWEDYRGIKRLGRKTRLPDAQRAVLWKVFETFRTGMRVDGFSTMAEVFTRLAAELANRRHPPYEHIVVDEAQDVSVAQLKFLAAIGGARPDSLFFAGDLGQRIFQTPFSWKSLGVDIRGRSRTLAVNYRTSHQIRSCADRLLGDEVADVDGNVEIRKGTVSVFNGPPPEVREFATMEAEVAAVADWLRARMSEGISPHELGAIVRSDAETGRAARALDVAAVPYSVLDDKMQSSVGKAALCTMHLAKGLEFRAVAIMACDDEVIPSQTRIEQVTDDGDLEEVYATERHLLYVACTRARDHLLLSGVTPVSEFLDDFKGSQ